MVKCRSTGSSHIWGSQIVTTALGVSLQHLEKRSQLQETATVCGVTPTKRDEDRSLGCMPGGLPSLMPGGTKNHQEQMVQTPLVQTRVTHLLLE